MGKGIYVRERTNGDALIKKSIIPTITYILAASYKNQFTIYLLVR